MLWLTTADWEMNLALVVILYFSSSSEQHLEVIELNDTTSSHRVQTAYRSLLNEKTF